MPNASEQTIRIGVLTVSDRASRGVYEDRSGPAIRSYLDSALSRGWEADCRVVADDREEIRAAIERLCDEQHCCLVLTTGGTGPAPRDVTPDATIGVCDKLLPGFGERMRAVSADKVPTAILSRQQAGIRGETLIVNLPGHPDAIGQCLDAVFPAIVHCVRLLGHTITSKNDAPRPACDGPQL